MPTISRLDEVLIEGGVHISRYAEAITRMGVQTPAEADLERLILFDDGAVRIYYAPFDWVNGSAEVVIVGITPGRNTMMVGLREMASCMQRGATVETALRVAKQAASFSNMRQNLTAMLDTLGLNHALGLLTCGVLFNGNNDLLHSTSCIRYPVLVKRKGEWTNYTGHSPKLGEWDVGRRFIVTLLASELRRFPTALVIPNGEAVAGAIGIICRQGVLDRRNCLFGFPHASPANGHRVRKFEAYKAELAAKVADWAQRRTAAS